LPAERCSAGIIRQRKKKNNKGEYYEKVSKGEKGKKGTEEDKAMRQTKHFSGRQIDLVNLLTSKAEISRGLREGSWLTMPLERGLRGREGIQRKKGKRGGSKSILGRKGKGEPHMSFV